MKKIWTIFCREFSVYFSSPIGYIYLIVFAWINAALFVPNFFTYPVADMRQMFFRLPYLLCILIPLITMRLWAEERKENTIEMLLTFPIESYKIVLGKFFAALCFFLLVLGCTLPIPIMLGALGRPDWGVVFSSYLGAFLLGSFFLSIGIFISGLARDQIVSAILSLGICFAFYLIGDEFIVRPLDGWAPELGTSLKNSLGIIPHYENFSRGLVSFLDILYFLVWSCLFLFLNAYFLDGRKRKYFSWMSTAAFTLCLGIGIAFNLLIADATFARMDWTEEKVHTVHQNTIDLLKNLNSPIRVTYYVSPRDQMPTHMKNLERDVLGKLEEIKIVSVGNFDYRVVHLNVSQLLQVMEEKRKKKKDSTFKPKDILEYTLYEQGIRPTPTEFQKGDETTSKWIYSSLAISYRDKKQKILERIIPADLSDFEYQLAKNIDRLTRETYLFQFQTKNEKLDLADHLNRKNLKALRKKFSDSGVSLSSRAKVLVHHKNQKWAIEDHPKYTIKSLGNMLAVYRGNQYVASIDERYRSRLNRGKIPLVLRQKCARKGNVFTPFAKLKILEKDQKWEISDRQKYYLKRRKDPKKKNDSIHVCIGKNPVAVVVACPTSVPLAYQVQLRQKAMILQRKRDFLQMRQQRLLQQKRRENLRGLLLSPERKKAYEKAFSELQKEMQTLNSNYKSLKNREMAWHDRPYSILIQKLKEEGYDVKEIQFSKNDPLPEEYDVLIILQPRLFSERQKWEIARALYSGKKVFLGLQNYVCLYGKDRGESPPEYCQEKPSVSDWLEHYGIYIDDRILMDSHYDSIPTAIGFETIRSEGREYRKPLVKYVNLPIHIRIQRENIHPENFITKKIHQLPYLWGSSFRLDLERISEEKLALTTLLRSSFQSCHIQSGGDWLEKMQRYMIRKEPPSKAGYAFDIDFAFQDFLNDLSIPKELKRAFFDQNESLSSSAWVEKQKFGWQIQDGNRLYLIYKAEKTLKVYKRFKKPLMLILEGQFPDVSMRFRAESLSFQKLDKLILKWRKGKDPLSRYIYKQLLSSSKKACEKYRQLFRYLNSQFSQTRGRLNLEGKRAFLRIQEIKKEIISELNRLLSDPNLYSKERFKGVSLDKETQKILQKKQNLFYLNKRLLHDAYPKILGKNIRPHWPATFALGSRKSPKKESPINALSPQKGKLTLIGSSVIFNNRYFPYTKHLFLNCIDSMALTGKLIELRSRNTIRREINPRPDEKTASFWKIFQFTILPILLLLFGGVFFFLRYLERKRLR